MKNARPLNEIAYEIINDMMKQNPANWRQRYAYALAYVEPMATLTSIDENYGFDSGRSIVAYALGNLNTWKGEKAREIKKELNAMLK